MKFTEKYLKSLKSSNKRYDVKEDSGLILRVSKDESKTFSYVYKFNGKTKRITIGSYPTLSLADARTELARIKKLRHEGIDPALEKQEAKQKFKATPTLSEFAEEFIERWCKPNKKSWKSDKQNLDKYIIPYLGDKKITDIKRRDIVRIIDPIREKGAETQANRVYACVRRMFNFAVERGVIESSPATHIKSTREQPRERVLSREEIPIFFQMLNDRNPWIGTRLSLEMILRTAQRPGEVRLMEKSEIDQDKMLWVIPGNKTKNGLPQTVPLTQKMLSIIDVAKSVSNSDWVFSSPVNSGEPLAITSLSRVVKRAVTTTNIDNVTPHDLRRTAATLITELGFNRLVIDKLLNHKDQSVSGIYDRHSYDKEKRQALEAWERELSKIFTKDSTKDNVIPINA